MTSLTFTCAKCGCERQNYMTSYYECPVCKVRVCVDYNRESELNGETIRCPKCEKVFKRGPNYPDK